MPKKADAASDTYLVGPEKKAQPVASAMYIRILMASDSQ